MDMKIAEGKVFKQWSTGQQGFDINIEFHQNLALMMGCFSLGL